MICGLPMYIYCNVLFLFCRVFTKIKSRSAHMKSHRPPDTEPVRRKEKDVSCSSSFNVFVSTSLNT